MAKGSPPEQELLVSDSRRGFGQKNKAKGKELWKITKSKCNFMKYNVVLNYTLLDGVKYYNPIEISASI